MPRAPDKEYFFLDVDLRTKRIVEWGSGRLDRTDLDLEPGYHRVLLTPGQWRGLVAKLEAGR